MKKGQASSWKKGKIHSKAVIEAQLRGDQTFNQLIENPAAFNRKNKGKKNG